MPEPVRDIQIIFNEDLGVFNPANQTLIVPVNVTWLEPSELYGILQKYSLTVQSLEGDIIYQNDSISPSVLSIMDTVLVSPFENYSATVNATTGGGSSSLTSPFFYSPEAGTIMTYFAFQTPNCCIYNYNQSKLPPFQPIFPYPPPIPTHPPTYIGYSGTIIIIIFLSFWTILDLIMLK